MSKIKDVFKDYQEENNLINAEIENINLFKKSKKIEIGLSIKEPVTIGEISSFEDYLKDRFQIQKVSFIIKIEAEEKGLDFSSNMKKDWKDIIKYLSKNYPLCKAILGTSSVEINENIVKVSLKTKGAEFLRSYEIDREIEKIALNLYGVKCKVECKEDITKDIIKEQEKYLEDLEKTACEDLMYEINLQNEAIKEHEQKEIEEKLNEKEIKKPLILRQNRQNKR